MSSQTASARFLERKTMPLSREHFVVPSVGQPPSLMLACFLTLPKDKSDFCLP